MSNKPLFNKICIVGVGLIGGSLGLAIKKRRLAKVVMGVVRRRKTGAEALRARAVHGATMSLKHGVRGADLVLLCSPVSTIIAQMKILKRFLMPGAIVADVASTKALIDTAARKYLKGVRFVGSHPMAGSSHKGAQYADPDLFENTVCYLTSYEPSMERFWRALGAKVFYLSPERHDQWVARTSHLPHVMAFAMFQSDNMRRLGRLGLEATNPSIRDLARLSKSDPKLWADILISNKKEIMSALGEHEKAVRTLKKALGSQRARAIEKFIQKANRGSQRLAPKVV